MHFRARSYDPRVGRFVQRDPVDRTLHSYEYGFNSPLIYADPSGKQPKDDAAFTPNQLAIKRRLVRDRAVESGVLVMNITGSKFDPDKVKEAVNKARAFWYWVTFGTLNIVWPNRVDEIPNSGEFKKVVSDESAQYEATVKGTDPGKIQDDGLRLRRHINANTNVGEPTFVIVINDEVLSKKASGQHKPLGGVGLGALRMHILKGPTAEKATGQAHGFWHTTFKQANEPRKGGIGSGDPPTLSVFDDSHEVIMRTQSLSADDIRNDTTYKKAFEELRKGSFDDWWNKHKAHFATGK
jgi:hypothetical protein